MRTGLAQHPARCHPAGRAQLTQDAAAMNQVPPGPAAATGGAPGIDDLCADLEAKNRELAEVLDRQPGNFATPPLGATEHRRR
jgi:hypothetical protein